MPFETDLKFGKDGEKRLLELLEIKGFKVLSVAPDRKFSDYDIMTDKGSIEVKTERRGLLTGNAFVEYKDGDKLTGLSITKADYHAFIFDRHVYFCRTDALKEFIKSNLKYLEVKTKAGEFGTVTGFVIPRKYFEKVCISSMKFWLLPD